MKRKTSSNRCQMGAVIVLGIAWCLHGQPVLAAPSTAPAGARVGSAASQPAGSGTPSQPSIAATRPASQRTSGGNTSPSDKTVSMLSRSLVGSSVSGIGSAPTARTASEATVSASNPPVIGLPGQRATPPITNGVIGNIPGIQRGYAAGLGFAGRQNVLTWQRNPTDRPCQDLVRAGFFPNLAGCNGKMRR